MNGFQAVDAVALKNAGRVDDGVDIPKPLAPMVDAIVLEIAAQHLPRGKHQPEAGRVSSAGDDLVTGARGLDGDMPPDESASADDQNPHNVSA